MYSKAGKNIKGAAIVVLVVGIIISLTVSIMLFVEAGDSYRSSQYYGSYDYFDIGISSMLDLSEYYVPVGIFVLIGGILASIIRFIIIFGFGALVDKYLNNGINNNSSTVESKRWRCSNCGVVNTEKNCINCGMNRYTKQVPTYQVNNEL